MAWNHPLSFDPKEPSRMCSVSLILKWGGERILIPH